MNSLKLLCSLLLFVCFINPTIAQKTNKEAIDKIRNKVEKINHSIEQWYIHKRVDSVLSLYDEKSTYMPEYKPSMHQLNTIQLFFSKWFEQIDINSYERKIYEVKPIDNYFLEIGNFSIGYIESNNQQKKYDGKYMIVWKIAIDKSLVVVSEIFGSNTYLGAVEVPYANVEIKECESLPNNKISVKTRKEITEVNNAVIRSVVKGDSEARANRFSEDAIYMPHFKSILIGLPTIRSYMLETYSPEAKLYVTHTYGRMYDLGQFILVNGHFQGGWGDKASGGEFEGNMLNLWKRTTEGELKMYRQLAK